MSGREVFSLKGVTGTVVFALCHADGGMTRFPEDVRSTSGNGRIFFAAGKFGAG